MLVLTQRDYSLMKERRSFHDQWQEENAPIAFMNCGQGILQDLFIEENPFNVILPKKVVEVMSSRDRQIVATVIQWLGSNCGMGFLSAALQRFNARIVFDQNK
jgi:hypothetical protein